MIRFLENLNFALLVAFGLLAGGLMLIVNGALDALDALKGFNLGGLL